MSSSSGPGAWLAYLLLLLIIAGAWALRDTAARETYSSNPIRNDALEYYHYAINMKIFGVFSKKSMASTISESTVPQPDASRSPGYPAFISPLVFYPPSFEMVTKIRRMQAVLDTVTVLMVYAIARLLMPMGLALLPTFFAAISPHLISMTTYLLSETLFTFVLTSAIAVGGYALQGQRKVIKWLGFGVLIGLTYMVKTSMLYILVFLLPLLMFTIPGKRQAAIGVLCVVIGYTVVVLPWELRNKFNVPASMSAHSEHGVTSLHNGTYPGLTADVEDAIPGLPHRSDPEYSNYQSYSQVLGKLLGNAKEQPGRYLGWYLWGKPEMFFSWSIVGGYGDIFVYHVDRSPYFKRPTFQMSYAASRVSHWPLMVLGLLFIVLCWLPPVARRCNADAVAIVRLTSIPVLYLLALAVVTTPLPRYSIPLRPLMYLLACAGVWQCLLAARANSAASLYPAWDPIGSLLSRWRVHAVSKHLPQGVHLDVACGDNRLVRALGFGYGIDIAPYAGTQLVCRDFSDLPFADESLDSASVLAALNYFESPERTLQELQRTLKPGGVVVITLLSKPVSRYWHMLRDRGLPRITFDDEELAAIVARTDLRWRTQEHFMLGLNRLIILQKPAAA